MAKIVHVNVNVADLDRSVAFYGAAFGFRVFERQASSGYADGDLRVAYLRADDSPVEIELSEYAGLKSFDYGEGPFGNAHIAVAVEDLDAEHRRLATLSPTITAIESYVVGGKALNRYFFVRDPDGFPIEVIERNERYR